MRSFIALPLNSQIQTAIDEIQTRLKKTESDVKWVKPEQAHLTLKFLGDVPEKNLEEIKRTVAEVCSQIQTISSSLTQLGAFPKPDYARVIWAGIDDPEQKIAALASAIEEALVPLKFPKEKRAFKPHITIGRVRSDRNLRALARGLENYSLPANLHQNFNEVVVFQSTLTQAGPIYSALEKCPLLPSLPQSRQQS